MKFSRDRKTYIDFQLDVLGGAGGGILKMSVLRERFNFVCVP